MEGAVTRALVRMMRHKADMHVQTSTVVVMGLLAIPQDKLFIVSILLSTAPSVHIVSVGTARTE